VQSPIEAEIVIWWPCAHLDRIVAHGTAFVLDPLIVPEYVHWWILECALGAVVELESSWTPVSYSVAPWIGGFQCVCSWHRDLWVPPVGQSDDIPVGG